MDIHPKAKPRASLQVAVLNLMIELERKNTPLTKEDVFEVLNHLALTSEQDGSATLIDAIKSYYITQHENL